MLHWEASFVWCHVRVLRFTKWSSYRHTSPVSGSKSGIEMFRSNLEWHKCTVLKSGGQYTIDDHGEFSSKYSSTWSILMDKGYTRITDSARAIIVSKKPVNRWQTTQQRVRNEKISSDRVVVENYSGRICTLGLFGLKWRWDEKKYSVFVSLDVALTNANVMWNLVRKLDGKHFKSILVRIISIGSSAARERAADKKESKKRRKRRLLEQIESVETECSEILLTVYLCLKSLLH